MSEEDETKEGILLTPLSMAKPSDLQVLTTQASGGNGFSLNSCFATPQWPCMARTSSSIPGVDLGPHSSSKTSPNHGLNTPYYRAFHLLLSRQPCLQWYVLNCLSCTFAILFPAGSFSLGFILSPSWINNHLPLSLHCIQFCPLATGKVGNFPNVTVKHSNISSYVHTFDFWLTF